MSKQKQSKTQEPPAPELEKIVFYRDSRNHAPARRPHFYASWDGDRFILLHHFVKKSNETPEREKATARRRLAEARKEHEQYEQHK
jgi:phage-related protein